MGMESASCCYSSQIRHDSILTYFRGDPPLSAATYLKEHDVLHHEMETQMPHFQTVERQVSRAERAAAFVFLSHESPRDLCVSSLAKVAMLQQMNAQGPC